jgi:hypothetical protein
MSVRVRNAEIEARLDAPLPSKAKKARTETPASRTRYNKRSRGQPSGEDEDFDVFDDSVDENAVSVHVDEDDTDVVISPNITQLLQWERELSQREVALKKQEEDFARRKDEMERRLKALREDLVERKSELRSVQDAFKLTVNAFALNAEPRRHGDARRGDRRSD